MRVIHPDHERRYNIPGVPGPARRPVDIDATTTGFKRLRSLRLYRFSLGAPIDGHAEEDEVFVIVTAGIAEIRIGLDDGDLDSFGIFTLSAFADGGDTPCVAYLPPQSVYRLTPHTELDVAYARATPTEYREPKVFRAEATSDAFGVTTLLNEQTHAQHLRLRLSRIALDGQGTDLDLREHGHTASERLIHLRSATGGAIGTISNAKARNLHLDSWDTVALAGGEQATLHLAPGNTVAMLTVSAE